jgi:CubicO group peptidase (beta-lactamase class C family)
MDRQLLSCVGAAIVALLFPLAAVAGDTVGVLIDANSYTLLQIPGQAQKRAFHFGNSYAYDHGTPNVPFVGNFDGGGDSIGYYNSRERRFYLAYENEGGVIDQEIEYDPIASPTRKLWPVVLDNGGMVQVGVYDPGTETFCLKDLAPDPCFVWSWPQALVKVPVVGDWDGDGTKTLGLYSADQDAFRIDDAIPPSGSPTVIAFNPSGSGDFYPIAGEWDPTHPGDEVGVYDVVNATFHQRKGDGTEVPPIVFTDGVLAEFNGMEPDTGPDLIPQTYPLVGTWDLAGGPEPPPFAWIKASPASQGMNGQRLQAAAAKGGSPAYAHLHSLLVARNDHLVSETYYRGWTRNVSNNLVSATKSVLSALYGVAFRKRCIDTPYSGPLQMLTHTRIEENLDEYDALIDPAITLRHMMTMTSGFDQSFVGDNIPLELLEDTDWLEWTFSDGWQLSQLGSFGYYGANNMIGAEILRRYVVNDPDCLSSDLGEFAKQELFDRLGIWVTRWDHEPSSNVIPRNISPRKVFYGPSQMFMRPRDLARFGQLFLEKGQIGSPPILDATWVNKTTADLVTAGSCEYGAWWWREYGGSRSCSGPPQTHRFPGGDLHYGYHALGYGGQQLFIWPTLDLLVVMTSCWNRAANPPEPGDQCPFPSGMQIAKNESLMKEVLKAIVEEYP